MDLLKCWCANLSKDQLEKIIISTHKVNNFVNNPEAVETFKMLFDKTPQPNAIKYLHYIATAKRFKENLSELVVEDDGPETFMGMIDDELADRLCESANDEGRRTVLDEIIKVYELRLSRSKEYEQFQVKLKKAYQGIESISNSDSD